MLSIPKNSLIYFYAFPVDLRKGFEGLAYISCSIADNLTEDSYFVFLNRKRNRMKILYRSSENFFYWFIRSRKGVFAPKKTVTSLIKIEELQMILNGNFPNRLKAI